jgi:hypothetical protein
MDFMRIVFSDLARNPRRTPITVTSVAVFALRVLRIDELCESARSDAGECGYSVRLVCRNKAGLGHGLPQAYTPKTGPSGGRKHCGCAA